MSFSTFSGPLRVGTVKDGAAKNCGLVTLSQVKLVNFNDADNSVACIVPAGALIMRATFVTTTTFTAATTVTLSIGGTAVSSAVTITTGGSYAIATTQSQAVGQLQNVGTADASVTYTVAEGASTAGQGYLVIEYIQRADDRSVNPANS
jgi:uncharacterized protein with beta-barrel porin domain